MRRQVASLLIPLLLLTAVAAARAAAPSRAEVLELIRGGDSPAALAACRAYLGEHPFDRVMIYNLACLEARGGLAGAALASLERAAAARFDDLAQLETDPDLAPLRGEPRFAALVTEIRTRLVLAAAERGVRLAPGRPAEVTLHPDGPSPLSALPRISLEWRPEGLVVSGIDGGPWPGDAQSSPRLLLTLGPRDRDEPYLARGAFVFAFGAGPKGSGWGAVRVPALDRWQPVAELAPRFGQGGRPWTVTVPWSLVQPFHPLTDPAFGLNAALTLSPVAGEPGPWDAVALLADPRTWDPDAPERRVARLDFDASAWSRPALLGRLADSIVHGDVLDFELTIVSPAAGQGTLSIDFLDSQGRSLLPGGAEQGVLTLDRGLQRLPRQATFAGLKTGSSQLRAEIGFPGGETAVWSTPILNLAPGWADTFAGRIDALGPCDRPTAAHYLAALQAALAAHVPRRHPGAMATTLGDLAGMLERARATGSVLPTEGPGLLVYPGPDGGDRLCTVYRPHPGPRRGAETPVLILDDGPGGEDRFAGRFARFYEHGNLSGAGARRPLYLVPHLPTGNRPTEARAALDYIRTCFRTDEVPVAGVNAGGGTALLLAADGRGGVGALQILAGGHLEPWPWADEGFLAERLARLPRDLAVDWTDFSRETAHAGQGPVLLRVLQAAGRPQFVHRTAGGALGPSVAADRIVLWAEQLPVPGSE